MANQIRVMLNLKKEFYHWILLKEKKLRVTSIFNKLTESKVITMILIFQNIKILILGKNLKIIVYQ